MADPAFVLNGIDAETGGYLVPPVSAREIVARLRRRAVPPRIVPRGFLGDARDLAASGWGVVFASSTTPAVREALAPLLEHRKTQAAAADPRRFRISSYRPGESADDFLRRHRIGPGPALPRRLPYYLLLVGDPVEIPFEFQYRLDVQYAVGRLCFATAEEYATYAATVVAAETGRLALPRRAALFATSNPDDRATALSCDRLAGPISRRLAADDPGWEIGADLGAAASHARLTELLTDREPPALLFTATHGVGFANGRPRQQAEQGALVCQDWPGPRAGRLRREEYFAADDVSTARGPAGLVSFHFACFGGGTPERDDFAHRGRGAWDDLAPRRIAPEPFVARLPLRLLGHPRGGALAVVGHVERAWAMSFLWGSEAQIELFAGAFERLLECYPVGAAMEHFGQRYAELGASLGAAYWRRRCGEDVDPDELIRLWTAHHDARNYIVLGDPAVRLAAAPAAAERV